MEITTTQCNSLEMRVTDYKTIVISDITWVVFKYAADFSDKTTDK